MENNEKQVNWYTALRRIRSQEGFVVIDTTIHGKNEEVVLTVDEAMDRAVAIQNITTDPNAKDLAAKLMEAAAQARRYADEVRRKDPGGDHIELKLKEETLRRMELLKHRQLEELKRSHIPES